MRDHVSQWLGAYHDGELRGARRQQVEDHLAECSFCRAELEELRGLSFLLKETPVEAEFLSAERFAANLALRLPRRETAPATRKLASVAWWLVPVGLMLAWAFVETTLSLSTVASLAAGTGLFGSLPAGESALQVGWFGTALNLLGGQLGQSGDALVALFNDANRFIARIVAPLVPQALIAAGYLGWLLAWWLANQEPAALHSEKPQQH